MKRLLPLFGLFTLLSTTSYAQQGMGVGNNNPQEMLDVSGAIKIGNTTTTNVGTIRWNGTNFQGYNGSSWVNLDGGSGASGWELTGNTGIAPATNFIGTTDNNQLRFRTNGTERVTILSSGGANATKVGIGTTTVGTQTTAQAGLEIAGNVPNIILNDVTGGSQDDLRIRNGGGTAVIENGTTNTVIMSFGLATNSNNVGIGTNNPADRLHVEGPIRMADGNQAAGRIPISDANGTMTWSDPGSIGNALSGAGLNFNGTSNAIDVDVDNSTVELATGTDEVRVKAEGITANEIATGAVTADEILDGTILTDDIASGGNDRVLSTDATGNVVWQSQSSLSSNSEGDGLVFDGANSELDVNTDNLTVEIDSDQLRVKAEGITANEIATSAVTTDEILDGTILTDDIATGAVSTDEILDGTILTDDIATGAVSSDEILDGTILTDDIATGGVNSSDILDATILTEDIATGAVTSDEILDGTITTQDIGQNGAATGQVLQWNGSAWTPVSGSSLSDGDWTISGNNQYSAVSDNVGIGTTTPDAKLEVYDAGATTSMKITKDGSQESELYFVNGNNGTQGTTLGLNTAEHFVVQNNYSDKDIIFNVNDGGTQKDLIFIDASTARVGINLSSPQDKLHVSGATRITGGAKLNDGSASVPSYRFYNDGNTGMYAPDSDELGFTTGGSEAARIDDNGNIGIGTTSPSAKLDVEGTFQLVDGTEGANKVLTSDAQGNATWQTPTADGDGDSSNELQDLSSVSVGTNRVINITGGTSTVISVADFDNSSSNELQTLSISGSTLSLSNGGGSVTVPSGGGAFSTTGGVTSNAPGLYTGDDFVFGSPTLGYSGNALHASRFYFDKSKSAFRAGSAVNEWDLANVGDASAAFGFRNAAAGERSMAWGATNQALLNYSTAWGEGNIAPSGYETVLGRYSTTYSAVGIWNPADRLFTIGNGTSTSARSNALTIYKNGRMNINDAYNMPIADGTASQVLTTDGSGNATWQSAATSNTLDQAYDEGGAGAGRVITASDGAVRINGDDGFIVTGTLGSGDPIEVSGAGVRMFFNPNKAAFRAGSVQGTEWDPANIGTYSSVIGLNSLASGHNSTAIGYLNQATGDDGMVFGYNSIASGQASHAMGFATESESAYESAHGMYDTDYTPNSTTAYNAADRLFVVGNGTGPTTRSDALVILKNGNTGVGTSTPSATLDVEGSLQLVDGNEGAGKVLTSDASGNASWSNNAVMSTIPLWNSTTGTGYSMTNTGGTALSNCESGFIPSTVSATGNVQVKVVILVTSASGTNNFQLKSGGSFPIIFSDVWTWTTVPGGNMVVESEWKTWSAGTTPIELELFGWTSSGGHATFTSAYVLVKSN